MTDEQKQKQQEAFNEYIRQQQEKAAQERFELLRAQQRAAIVQDEINNRVPRKYASIVAFDLKGGFSKDGQIPWHYPADFKWFQNKTKGHVCVMGRVTYDDINARLGEKAAESVLPGRACYVVTSRPLERNNATAIKSIHELDVILDRQDVPYDKTVFYIGGERIYAESLSKVDTVYTTVVKKEDIGCDKFFPVDRLNTAFKVHSVEVAEGETDLVFVTWTRSLT